LGLGVPVRATTHNSNFANQNERHEYLSFSMSFSLSVR